MSVKKKHINKILLYTHIHISRGVSKKTTHRSSESSLLQTSRSSFSPAFLLFISHCCLIFERYIRFFGPEEPPRRKFSPASSSRRICMYLHKTHLMVHRYTPPIVPTLQCLFFRFVFAVQLIVFYSKGLSICIMYRDDRCTRIKVRVSSSHSSRI